MILETKKVFLSLILIFFTINICVDANPPPIVKEIYIMGNEEISSNKIISYIKYTQSGHPLNTDNLQKDLDILVTTGLFDEVKARIVSLNDGCLVYLDIKESTHKVNNVEVVDSTNNNYNFDTNLKEGEIITKEKLENEASRLNTDFYENGLFTEVRDVSINKDGDIVFNVQKKTIEKIEFEGLEKTKLWLAMKFIEPLGIGSEPTKEKIQAALQRLQDSGYFSSVSAKTMPSRSDPSTLILIFIVSEDKAGEWRLGGGHNSRSGMIATGSIKNTNINGEGKEIGINARYNKDDNSYSISYRDNYLNKTNNSLQINMWKSDFSGEIDDLHTYEKRKGVSIFYEKHLNETKKEEDKNIFSPKLIMGFKAENQDYRTLSDHEKNTLRVFTTALENNRIHEKNITEGTYAIFKIDKALKILGGDTDFTKISGELREYIPTSDKSLIAFRVSAQFLLGDDAPKAEQISLGGDYGVRGIPEGNNRGKQGYFATVEYRHNLSDIIQGVIFADIGRTTGLETSQASSDAGIGLRIKSGMGLVRLDLAKAEGRAWQTIFGFGQTF